MLKQNKSKKLRKFKTFYLGDEKAIFIIDFLDKKGTFGIEGTSWKSIGRKVAEQAIKEEQTYALLKVLEYRMEGKDKSVPEIQMPKMQMRISQRGGLVRNG